MNTRGVKRAYKQIKVLDNGTPKWVYLHRELMRQHLGRDLTNAYRVIFKEGVDPLSDFTIDELLLVAVAPTQKYKTRRYLKRRILETRRLLQEMEQRLESLGPDDDEE